MVKMMNSIISRIQKEFNNNPDLIIKDIKLTFKTIYILFLESVAGSNKVNDYVLKNIIDNKGKITSKNIASFLAGPNTIKINNLDTIEFYLTNGFTIIILGKNVFAIETKADINRSVTAPDVETSINGPKDSFTECYDINLGLIKRRIKSSTLKIKEKIIGRKTCTKVGILYFDDITDTKIIKNIEDKINKIDIDGIVDSSSLAFLLDGENKTVYPTIFQTERPDIVATALMEGKVAIILDTSPYVLIIPAFFADFINPNIDNYNKSINVNFIKVLRFIAFFISMITPALYIALIDYNQETIPTSLLINFAIQRSGVPFPAFVETTVMLLICEILRESDLRFPSSYGSTISILGAIIIGEASVAAGIVSPIMIIVVAVTFVSSLIITNSEMNNALRFFRAIFLIGAGLFGLYGMLLAFLFFIIYTTNTKSFDKFYFAPIVPFEKNYFFNVVLKRPLKKDKKRSKLFTNKNMIKQKENL